MSELSAVLTVYDYQENKRNISQIIKNAANYDFELIISLDALESEDIGEIEALCENVGLKNYRLLVHSEKNPGSGRNKGLQYATKSHVVFWDCDDKPHIKTVLEVLRSDLKDDVIYVGKFIQLLYQSENEFYSIEKQSLTGIDKFPMIPGIWRIIFPMNLIGKTKFVPSRMGEDQLFILEILEKNPRVQHLDSVFYTYIANRPKSLTGKEDKYKELFKTLTLSISFLNSRSSNSRLQKNMILRMLLSYIKIAPKRNFFEEIVRLIGIYKESNKSKRTKS